MICGEVRINRPKRRDDSMKRFNSRPDRSRRGAIAVLAAALAIVLIAMVAFSVDIGYVLSAKEELQRSADSSAIAACWEYGQRLATGNNKSVAATYARTTAAQYATLNTVTGHGVSIDSNTANDPGGDVVFGYINDFKNSQSPFVTNSASGYNAVKVRLRKSTSINGEV